MKSTHIPKGYAMPSAFDNMDRHALRATFKQEHFDLRSTNFDLLFREYHATNMLWKNTAHARNLGPKSRELYDIYVQDVVKSIERDKKYILSVELKNCRDLICLEYIQKSARFHKVFSEVLLDLQQRVQQYQKKLQQTGIPNRIFSDYISVGEACFILYLHPEYADVVKYMRHDYLLTEPMRVAIERGTQAKPKQKPKPKGLVINPDKIIIREGWQVKKL